MSERTHLRFPEPSSASDEPFVFFVVADPQLGMTQGPYLWDTDVDAFNRTLDILNEVTPRPRFCSVLGDFAHNIPDLYWETVPDCSMIFRKQNLSFKKCLSKVDAAIPVVLVPGNHDVGNTPTAASLGIYREEFGQDYFTFSVGSLQVIALNSTLFYDPSSVPREAEAQNQWLDRALENKEGATPQTRIILQHHPLWLDHCDEPDKLDSKSHTRGTIVANDCFHIPSERRQPLLDTLRKAGNVDSVFSGHFHQNRVSSSGRTPDNEGIRQVTTASASENLAPVEDGECMPVVEPGFRVVKYFPATADAPALVVSRYFSTVDYDANVSKLCVPLERTDPNNWDGFF